MPVTGLEIELGNRILSALAGATSFYVRRARLREGAGIVTLNQLSTDLGERVGSQLQRVMASVPVTQHQKVEEFLGSAEYKAIMRHLCALRLRHGPEYKEIAQQSISMMASASSEL